KTPGHRLEVQGRHRDGYDVPIELSVSALEGRDAPAFGIFIRDITDRKRAEVVRQQAFDEISRLKRTLEGERDYLREELGAHRVHEVVGQSPPFLRVM